MDIGAGGPLPLQQAEHHSRGVAIARTDWAPQKDDPYDSNIMPIDSSRRQDADHAILN